MSASRKRLNPRHQDMVRAKIQATTIINRLMGCIRGKVELSPQQVAAARILLDKSLPNLNSTEVTGVSHTAGPGLQVIIQQQFGQTVSGPERIGVVVNLPGPG
jgi:hypothetical protein